MGVIKDIVERRVNTTGVSEPVVTTQGADRVVVELPGVTDPEAVRKLVGQTGRLDFVPLGPTQATEGQQLDLEAVPAAVQRRPGLVRHRRHRPERPSRGRLRAEVRRRQACSPTTRPRTSASYFAITLDGAVVSAPVIQNAIPNGNVQITGGGLAGFNAKDAANLVTILKFGSLPFPITELSSEQISATLGSQFLVQTRPRRPHRDRAGHHCSCSSTTGCRASWRASR